MLNPMGDENEGTYRGGGRADTCDHGLSRKSLRAKNLLRVKLERKSPERINRDCSPKKG